MNGNVYYSPEEWGFTVVGDLELSEPSWDFDTVAAWKAGDGTVYWAHDSGCSCPTPFEDFRNLADLTVVNSHTISDLERFVAGCYQPADRDAFVKRVREAAGI